MARKKSKPDPYPLPLVLLASPFVLPLVLLHAVCICVAYAFNNSLESVLESQYRDRYGPRGNSGNKATELPQEVQLRIFHLLRTRAKLGEGVRAMDSLNWSDFTGRRDLAAARLVCLAWHGAATEALYTEVDLHRRRTCISFANTLVDRPRLARCVRRIAFPRSSRDRGISPERIYDGDPKEPHSGLALKLAIEEVVRLCDRAEDFGFYLHAEKLQDVSGLLQCMPRVSNLSLRGPGRVWNAERIPPFVLPPRLTQLTLLGQTLDPLLLMHLSELHTLRLSECAFDLPAFHALLAHLPRLRNVFWRENSISGAQSVGELLGPCSASLRLSDLTFISEPPTWRGPEVTLHRLHHFSALRDLTISARMLFSLEVPPPALTHLTITFAPLYSWYGYRERQGWKTVVLGVAERLVHCAHGWREMWSPDLSSIAVWDVIGKDQLVYWSVVAYILKGSLIPRGFDVSVNVILSTLQELYTHNWLRREESQCPLRKLIPSLNQAVRLVDYTDSGLLF